MSLRMKYFLNTSGVNNEQAAAIDAALVKELAIDIKPSPMISTKNRVYEFFIKKAKLKNLNAITCMGSLGFTSQKSIQFFNGDHKHVDSLRILYAITLLGHEAGISLKSSDLPSGKITVTS